MSSNYILGFYEKFDQTISFNELITASLEEIMEFTNGFSSSDELIQFLEEDTANMFSPLVIFDVKQKCTYVPLYETSRAQYNRVIAKNIADMFWKDPTIKHNIDEINKLDDIAFIKYLALYPELIALDDNQNKTKKKGGLHGCLS